MTTGIIFLCPHAAAKSVYASALLRREADRRGLDVEVDNAGTEPDDELLPVVRDRLAEEGLDGAGPPRLVAEHDLEHADIIINIGCDPAALPTSKSVHSWNIPNFSEDASLAFAALDRHVEELVVGLTQS